MKKTLLTTTFLIAGAFGLLAQGTIPGIVTFYNDPWSWNDSIENGGTVNYLILTAAGTPVEDATWSVQLFENGTARGDRIPFYGVDWPGVWNAFADSNGGTRSLAANGGVATRLSVGVYDSAGTQLVLGPEFDYTPPNSPTPAPADLLMKNFRGFAVPEPSTIALGVLGLGALLLFRRQK
jgi:hypothetical protein